MRRSAKVFKIEIVRKLLLYFRSFFSYKKDLHLLDAGL